MPTVTCLHPTKVSHYIVITMQPLTSLPREILEDILSNLDHKTLSRCLSVCWHLKTTINSSSELTYIIELAQDGMIDNPSMQMSHAERLLRLRDRRKAWNSLDWRASSVVPIKGLCHAYELVNGVFAKGIGGRDFTVAWLPSVDAKGHRLHRDDLKIRLRDFAIDPGQDLIIFLEEDDGPFINNRSVTLHVRSIMTHEAHPKARYPVLQFNGPPHEVFGAFIRNLFLQVADDIVAVLLSTGSPRLLLWNWREGFLISDSALVGHGLPTGALDFSFISPRAYILMCPEGDGSIVIEAFKSEPGFRPLHVATLFLPELQEDATIESLANHTSPFETPSRDEPFSTSPSSRLHVMSIQYDAPDATSHTHMRLFVHNRTFMKFVTSYFSKDFPEPEYALWIQWGPRATRMDKSFHPYTWLRWVTFV
ncbi:hypothetical protein D9615_008641 [Tricholomella constricta]|uniref:F-box domain-containing protein n=1 Tax=Tricholomella constricta TaxID=117010 RepID=A0A8H5H4C7_9AGAR|nr:hypothetical protein D9615_008641 [Tricholomella constricta]